MLSQNRKSLDDYIDDGAFLAAKDDIMNPSQCCLDCNCGPSTMLDVERKADPTQTTAGEILARECVDHIAAAAPTLPAATFPNGVLPESVVSRRNNAPVLHTVSDVLSIKSVCSETENLPSGENHVSYAPVQSCVVNAHTPDAYAMSQGGDSEAVD